MLCFFSVPLCYVYPAMLHYKACARTRKQKVADIALMVFGLIAAAYTTIQTVKVRFPAYALICSASVLIIRFPLHLQLMVGPAPAEPPTLGQCGRAPGTEDPLRGLL